MNREYASDPVDIDAEIAAIEVELEEDFANHDCAVAPPMTSEQVREMIDEAQEEQDKFLKAQIQWSVSADGTMYWGSGKVVPTIEAGLYKTEFRDQIGLCLMKQIISTDTLIELADSTSLAIVEEIKFFWNNKQQFTDRGLLHKRGILLMGDPGSGKTSTIQLVIKHMIANDGIVLYPEASEPGITAGALQMIRRLEKTRPILVILEDFETMVHNKGHENSWLSILDGEQQVDNIVFLATTNYISQIDKRFTDRPSRFDLLKQIDMPTRAMRKQYLKAKEPSLRGDELQLWLDATDELSIAHLKELIISVRCFGRDFNHTVDRLKEMRDRKYTEEEFIKKKSRVGIGR